MLVVLVVHSYYSSFIFDSSYSSATEARSSQQLQLSNSASVQRQQSSRQETADMAGMDAMMAAVVPPTDDEFRAFLTQVHDDVEIEDFVQIVGPPRRRIR